MMKVKNYPTNWRTWIKACTNNVQYFIIINGKPHSIIKSTRGICQGDPNSPFIYVLAMDYLSRLLNHLEKRGAIKGVSFDNSYSLNHFLLVDDILVFIEDDDIYLRNLQTALSLLKLALGHKIDCTYKSIIGLINVST